MSEFDHNPNGWGGGETVSELRSALTAAQARVTELEGANQYSNYEIMRRACDQWRLKYEMAQIENSAIARAALELAKEHIRAAANLSSDRSREVLLSAIAIIREIEIPAIMARVTELEAEVEELSDNMKGAC